MDILVSTNKKFETQFRHWQDAVNRQVDICVEDVWTEQQSKGAVGSLKFWIEHKSIDDHLLVIAGDNYFEFDLSQFVGTYSGKNALVAVYDIGDKTKASQFGVVQLKGDKIVEFEEKPAKPKSSLIATACYILPRRIFPLLFEYCAEGKRGKLGNFISYMVDSDEVVAHVFREPWFHIGAAKVIR